MNKPILHPSRDDGRRRVTRDGVTNGSVATVALCGLIVLGLMAPAGPLLADENMDAVRPADTSSPRATLKTFIDSCNEFHRLIQSSRFFDRTSPEHHPLSMRILDCLDTSELPEFERDEAAAEIAVCLKEILDRVDLPPYEEIPGLVNMDAAEEKESVTRWQIPGARITIARVEEGPRRHEYLFSVGTVERAVEQYQDVKALPYRTTGPSVSKDFYRWYTSAPGHPTVAALVDRLPDWAREEIGGQSVWKWAGLLLSVFVALLMMWVSYKLYGNLARRFHELAPIRYCLTIALPILAMVIPLYLVFVAYNYLTLRGTLLYVVSFCANIMALLASLVVVFGTTTRVAETIILSPRINPRGLNAQLIRIASRLLSLLAAVVIILEGGHYLGIPVTTLLASAGIGGLALALAAQDTLKTLLGTIMLLSDKPFRVGERVVFGKYDGTIEDIGLRSTKIRLLTGHQATIPNDELARSDIENVGRRHYIRRVANIHLPLDTPRDKVERSVELIRGVLENHEGMDPDFPPRVYFFDFGDRSFIIRVFYWYKPPNYWDYLAFSEKVNLALFRAFEDQGIQFSLPSKITHTSLESEAEPVEVTLLDKRDKP